MKPIAVESPFRRKACAPSRGAAALVVVMVLFFIVALVAAYTGRSLIFEQRTSANQYRSTQAFEAAEAGIEWALAMLNSGLIDANCQPLTPADLPTTEPSFRQRYLNIDATTGNVTVRLRSDGQPLRAACVFDGAAWSCSCPADAAPTLTAPTGAGPFPAFVVRLYDTNPFMPSSPPYPPGIVRVESTGCTRLDAADVCAATATAGDGRATVTILAALKSALTTPPTAAVTVRRDFTHIGFNTRAANADSSSGGFTLHVGGTLNEGAPPISRLGPAGTPADSATVINPDPPMAGSSTDAMFASVLGMARGTYRLQPAAIHLRCDAGDDCSGTALSNLSSLNPGRVLWLRGNVVLTDDAVLGSALEPMVLVIEGTATVTADLRITGVVYQVGGTWVDTALLRIDGAFIAESDLNLTAVGPSTTFNYDRTVLDRLRWTSGSFVRVPGSWRDF